MSRSPRFGLFLPQVALDFSFIKDAARAAEAAGYDHVWFIDHLDLPGQGDVLEGWTVAAAVAAVTERIRIGHLVLSAGFRHPAVLGKMAIALDRISDGRLDLGLGWAASPNEATDYGLSGDPGPVRRAKLAETVTIVRRMAAGGTISFVGQHFRVPQARCGSGTVQTQVPVFIGGAGPATMRLVRQLADWWNCPSYALADLARLIPQRGDARASANYSILLDQRRRGPASQSGNPRSPVLVGSPGAIAEVLARHHDDGVELFNLQFVLADRLMADLEWFMAAIAPQLVGQSLPSDG